MPSGEINTKVRESVARFYGSLMQMRRNGPVPASLVADIPAPGGFFKIADVYPVGQMEDATGIATVDGLQSASKLVEVTPRRWTGSLTWEQWLQGDANSGGQVSRAIRQSAMQVEADRQKRLANLLKNGGTGTDLFTTTNEGSTNSAAFADTKYIPRSNISFDNALTGSFTDTAAEIRGAVFEGLAQFDSMQNSIGGLLHDAPEDGAQYLVMVPPALREFTADALNPQLSNDAARLDAMGVRYVVNPYLSAASGGSDTVFYMFRNSAAYPALVAGNRGPEEFRSTVGDQSQAHLILFNGVLFQPYYAAAYDYGSTFNMLRLTNT